MIINWQSGTTIVVNGGVTEGSRLSRLIQNDFSQRMPVDALDGMSLGRPSYTVAFPSPYMVNGVKAVIIQGVELDLEVYCGLAEGSSMIQAKLIQETYIFCT